MYANSYEITVSGALHTNGDALEEDLSSSNSGHEQLAVACTYTCLAPMAKLRQMPDEDTRIWIRICRFRFEKLVVVTLHEAKSSLISLQPPMGSLASQARSSVLEFLERNPAVVVGATLRYELSERYWREASEPSNDVLRTLTLSGSSMKQLALRLRAILPAHGAPCTVVWQSASRSLLPHIPYISAKVCCRIANARLTFQRLDLL